MKKFFVTMLSLMILSSCTSLNSAQKREMATWEGEGLVVEVKDPGLAAGLNILPGFGDFYNGNIGLCVVNLLAWPLSVLWAPVGGASGASENNYYVTKAHVDDLAKNKQAVLNDLQAAFMMKQISDQEFFIATAKVKNLGLNDFKKNHDVSEFVPRLQLQPGRIPTSKDF